MTVHDLIPDQLAVVPLSTMQAATEALSMLPYGIVAPLAVELAQLTTLAEYLQAQETV